MNCPICGSKTAFYQEVIVLTRYKAKLLRCKECLFIYFDQPTWIEESYSKSISILDTGLVRRNFHLSRKLYVLIRYLLNGAFKGLDFGGGTGLFTRSMRDFGVPYFWQDKYTQNIHACGYEYCPQETYQIISCIELLEHIQNPIDTLKELSLKHNPDYIFFTTETHQGAPESNWWYLSLDTGQHISFYHKKNINTARRKTWSPLCGL